MLFYYIFSLFFLQTCLPKEINLNVAAAETLVKEAVPVPVPPLVPLLRRLSLDLTVITLLVLLLRLRVLSPAMLPSAVAIVVAVTKTSLVPMVSPTTVSPTSTSSLRCTATFLP
jgi:hypothetical protein